jgi:ATP-dependent DNA helicase RecG
MLAQELQNLIHHIQKIQAETQEIEVKTAKGGCPLRLYGTLSSFSNQDSGGIIVFGIDENRNFEAVGVYDLHDLQKKVTEQCNMMEPPVRPLFTICILENEVAVLSAEIPATDIHLRPCFYKGSGRLKGSFIRIGDADEPMTEYEIYSYEAYRKKYHDELRLIDRAQYEFLDTTLLQDYIIKLKLNRPHAAVQPDEKILDLMGLLKLGKPTLAALLLFSKFPQALLPQLGIVGTVVPGTTIGDLDDQGRRFITTKRMDGNLQQMLEDAIAFVHSNMQMGTKIDPLSGKRIDSPQYPIVAVREAILNALEHRDYSIHTEGMPIQILLFSNRLEIRNPGGIYGRMRIDQLGKIQPDTRNPVIANVLELLGLVENRYSGIPTIRREMEKAQLPEARFSDERGSFCVTLLNTPQKQKTVAEKTTEDRILSFCKVPRTRKELANFLEIHSIAYAMNRYIYPLVHEGKLEMKDPNNPSSHKQTYSVPVTS